MMRPVGEENGTSVVPGKLARCATGEPMSEKKVSKSAPVQATILKALVRGLALLPLRWAQAIGALFGWLLWVTPNRLRRTTLGNLELCYPEMPLEERRRLARKSLIESGKTVTETGAMWFWRTEKLLDRIEEVQGLEYFEQARESGKGVVVLVPHLGNWEILSRYLQIRVPVVALYRPPRIAEMDAFMRRAREQHGAKIVPADRRGLLYSARILSEGGGIGLLPDQEPLKQHGVFAPFFGVPALTMTLVARLTRRYGAMPLYFYSERTATGRFRLHFRPSPQGLDSEDLEFAAAQLNRGVEECVRRRPEQYNWSYRRFRTRPPSELRSDR